ncbi:hypothetical protein [Fimbriiglobus ruber]|uniref:hypothetical protein n=1 Tax=Fimbriiglobus ruber TaxID=1908690 RepID=UPI000B4A8A14|nr:hypothetical protein [Fimbriiglobus ruber]
MSTPDNTPKRWGNPSLQDPNTEFLADKQRARHSRPTAASNEATGELDDVERTRSQFTTDIAKRAQTFGCGPLVESVLLFCDPFRADDVGLPKRDTSIPLVKQLEQIIEAAKLHETLPYPLRLPWREVRVTKPLRAATLAIEVIVQLAYRAVVSPVGPTADRPTPAALTDFLTALFDLKRDPKVMLVVEQIGRSIRNEKTVDKTPE